ncbi:PQ-loop-domain-containing protein [Lindgomyces ingoldianus]|uniref:PQ-loop-domain-containing protein n=1 Tax=Lindgomyces ingoldianus TaxID=673940 RepID=A0ACB6Q7G0_9PLEO|nr:PQ-loop-domain-containing protein [Lindgomyces ingoldianus]KAF2462759.1 PQ-loop-domain-containing protein [Lindgomyces ingoldianus]
MFPPSQSLRLDIDAISQICGSVSIACWIVVFSPQIIENWRRSSADGLSVVFITVWLLGDFFNIFGAVLQGVLPTMTILAVYYTFADIVLLLQCFWYKGFTLSDSIPKTEEEGPVESGASTNEQTPLLPDGRQTITNGSHSNGHGNGYHTPPRIEDNDRRHSYHSQSSFRERLLSVDGTHLSPATPLLPDSTLAERVVQARQQAPTSTLQTICFNLGIIFLVCASGVFGWWLSARNAIPSPPPEEEDSGGLYFNLWGQIFGYICAILYLGSRVPQLLLNYRRKSTEGISMLFFLFACIGNMTYVMSIFAYKPKCKDPRLCKPGEARAVYGRYIAVNLSWLLGSFGTLLLDAFVFIQYFLYQKDEEEDLVP